MMEACEVKVSMVMLSVSILSSRIVRLRIFEQSMHSGLTLK
jgi:hypothetical protein